MRRLLFTGVKKWAKGGWQAGNDGIRRAANVRYIRIFYLEKTIHPFTQHSFSGQNQGFKV